MWWVVKFIKVELGDGSWMSTDDNGNYKYINNKEYENKQKSTSELY